MQNMTWTKKSANLLNSWKYIWSIYIYINHISINHIIQSSNHHHRLMQNFQINQKYFYVQNCFFFLKKIKNKNYWCKFKKKPTNFAYKILVCLIDLEWHRLLNLAGISQGMFHHDQPSILVSFMFFYLTIIFFFLYLKFCC